MNRKAIIIKKSEDGLRCIAVDEGNADILLKFFAQDERYKKKFNHICDIILGGHINYELYDKKEPDSKSKGVRAMKFFKGQENSRVYCREVILKIKTFVVIASELLVRKKQTKLKHRERQIIHKVASYEYTEIE